MTPQPPPQVSAGNLRGIMWMLAFTVCMSLMHASIRHVSAGIHPFEIAFFRLLFGLLAVAPFFVRFGLAPLKAKRFGLLTLRGVLNAGAMLAFFMALSLTPLAEVTALSFTAPLFAILLAMAVFAERVGPRRWAAILIGFAGTVTVLRPGFSEIGLGSILVLCSALLWGACMIIIKQLGKTESSATITTYMSLIMAPMALIPAIFVWTWPSVWEFAWLAAIGLFGGMGQLAMSEALKHAETHVVMPFDFAKLIWISLIAYAAFGEIPDIFVWAGGLLIFSSTFYITLRERRRKRA